MAREKIYHTDMSRSGQAPNVTGRVNFDFGAKEQAQAFGSLGKSVQNYGETVWKLDAQREFSEAALEARRSVNKLGAFIRDNHDLTAIDEEKQRTLDYLHSMDIKNGLARRDYEQWLNSSLPTIEKGIESQVREIQVEDWYGQAKKLQAEAIDAGNLAALQTYIDGGVSENIIDPAKAQQFISESEYGIWEKQAMDFPDAVLAKIDGSTLAGSNLDPGQVRAIRNAAEAQKIANKKQGEELSARHVESINKLIVDGVPMEEVLRRIRLHPTWSATMKTEMVDTYMASLKKWDTGAKNPYDVTQRPELVNAMYIKIMNGEPITKSDVVAVQNGTPAEGATMSYDDLKYLFGVIDARDDEMMKSDIVKGWMKRIDTMWGIDSNKPEEASIEVSGKALATKKMLHTVIQQAGGDVYKAMPAVKEILGEQDKIFIWSTLTAAARYIDYSVPFFGDRWRIEDAEMRIKKLQAQHKFDNVSDEELMRIAGYK